MKIVSGCEPKDDSNRVEHPRRRREKPGLLPQADALDGFFSNAFVLSTQTPGNREIVKSQLPI
jgi:hypothetical protein